jgi:hypothetical protein
MQPTPLAQPAGSARQPLTATVQSVLDKQTVPDAQVSASAQVVRPSFTAGLGPALHAPGGLAFGILAAAVLGPPTALKTEPQEPGGW